MLPLSSGVHQHQITGIHTYLDMRYPKISSSFVHGNEYTDSKPSGASQHRSSLDTFVIPNRTRLPSTKVSKTQPADLQIAYSRLHPETVKTCRKPVEKQSGKLNGSNAQPLRQAASTPLLQSLTRKKNNSTPLPTPSLSGTDHQSHLSACKAATSRLSQSGIAGQLSKLLHRNDNPHGLVEDSMHSPYATSFAESDSRATSTSSNNAFPSRRSPSSSEETPTNLLYVEEYNRTVAEYGLPKFFESSTGVEEVNRTADGLQRETEIGMHHD